MGKKMKNIMIYSVIILLCGAALAGYILQNNADDAGAAQDTQVQTTAVTLSVATPAEAAVPGEEAIERNAVMLTDGSNIAGRTEEENQAHIRAVMKKAVAKPAPNPVVGVGRSGDYAEATAEAVKNAGGMKDLIKQGDVVLIKPNICTVNKNAGSPVVTDYRAVQKIVDMAYEYGASRVIVAEGSFYGNVFKYEANGYISLKGAELYNFNESGKEDSYELKPEKSLTGKAIFIPKIYMDADVVINFAKLKTHRLTMVTLGLKNSIGIPSAQIYGNSSYKSGLHELGLQNAIMDLNMIRKPDLTLIEGIVGGEGQGPEACTPVKSEVIFAGRDIVSVDTVAATFMGTNIEYITHIRQAEEIGLGIGDLTKIKIAGADLNSIKMKFNNWR